MSDDESIWRDGGSGDFRGEGVRIDPTLPPMTPAGGRAASDGVPSEETDQREAVRELNEAEGRGLSEES